MRGKAMESVDLASISIKPEEKKALVPYASNEGTEH